MSESNKKKYTIDDIQVFIMTHNRVNYLKESIESLLNQTAGIKELTVLDNESTDNTEEVVKSYAQCGVKYIRTEGFLGNFHKAQELASREYCLIFHDDDLLHPQYLETVLEIINNHENITYVSTRFTNFSDDKVPKMKKLYIKDYYLLKNVSECTKYMYFAGSINFASSVYKTALFKKYGFEYDKYNKFCDGILMLNVAREGQSAVINNPKMMFLRRHGGQDQETCENVLNLEHCVDLAKFYLDIFRHVNDTEALKMCKNLNYKRFYLFMSNKLREQISYEQYLDILVENGLGEYVRRAPLSKKEKREGQRYVMKLRTQNLVINSNIFLSLFNTAKYLLESDIKYIKLKKTIIKLVYKIKFHNLICDIKELIHAD